MNQNQYFSEMQKIGIATSKKMFEYLDGIGFKSARDFCNNDIPEKADKGFYSIISELPSRRQLPIRAYFIANAYKALGGNDNKWMALAAACELELCSMYYQNRDLDGKGIHKTEEDKQKHEIAALCTQNLAMQMIIKEYPGLYKDRLINFLELMTESVNTFYSGQYLDAFVNTYNLQHNQNFDAMITLCDERMDRINATYFRNMALMVCNITSSNSKKAHALSQFGWNYGMLLQIVNDIADFVPSRFDLSTSEKTPDDSYSDVLHGKLTYPTIYTLHHGSEKEKEFLKTVFEKGQDNNPDNLEELTRMLITNGSFEFAKTKAREHASQAIKSLDIFPRPYQKELTVMCSIAYSNKYYRALAMMK